MHMKSISLLEQDLITSLRVQQYSILDPISTVSDKRRGECIRALSCGHSNASNWLPLSA